MRTIRNTSREAYASSRDRASTHRAKIMRVMNEHPYDLFSSEEIAKKTGLDYLQVVRRMSELEKDNRVLYDKNHKKLNKSGAWAGTWTVFTF